MFLVPHITNTRYLFFFKTSHLKSGMEKDHDLHTKRKTDDRMRMNPRCTRLYIKLHLDSCGTRSLSDGECCRSTSPLSFFLVDLKLFKSGFSEKKVKKKQGGGRGGDVPWLAVGLSGGATSPLEQCLNNTRADTAGSTASGSRTAQDRQTRQRDVKLLVTIVQRKL